MVLRLSCLASVAVAALAAGAPAYAQQPTTTAPPTAPVAPEDDEEVILKADQFEENRETSVITASGNVEIRVGQRTLKADKVIYDRLNETVRAQGNVQITDEGGQVQFADEIEADQEFSNGFATRFSARLGGTGLVTASSAVRTDGVRNSLEQVVFTNCPVCEDKGQDPTWALRARRATLDQEDQMISYQDAVLELGGLPVLYVPWFAHPDPNSERRSGLLIPDAGVSSKVGVFYEQPYLWVVSPSEDLVIAPMLSTNVNPLLKLDWRRRFFSGFIEAEGSVTYESDFDSDGNKFGDQTWRSHLYAVGKFDINNDWQWGFGLERQTDDLYDHRYDIDGENELRGLIASQPRQLLSQAYLTGQEPDFYFEAGTFLFQGLRASDDDALIPKVAPALFTQKVFDFGAGGQLATDFSAVALFRDEPVRQPPITGPAFALDTARATASADWGSQYIFGPGLVFEPFASGRGDLYRIDRGDATGQQDVSRFLGVAGATVSYPLIARGDGMDLIIEPIAMAAYGTPDANELLNPAALPGDPDYLQTLIPNEDSLVFEADETNLFKPNAVTGYDLWEGGARGAVGVNAVARIGKDVELSALVGRRWREDADPAFNQLSNLAGEESDYVASVRADLARIVNVGARFRVDDEMNINRVDVDAGFDIWRVKGDARYFKVTGATPGSQDDEGIVWNGSFAVDDRWAAVVRQVRNITEEQDIRFSLGVRYQDECSYFLIAYERSGGRDRTLGPSEAIRFTFALTGLGGAAPSDFD
ncbi:MAG: LPS assembly protein LptD [Caulobacter sp.]